MSGNSSADWRDAYARVQDVILADDLVHNGDIYVRWIGNSNHFWYDRVGDSGAEYRIVDAETGEGWIAFTQQAVAASLDAYIGAPVDPSTLVLGSLMLLDGLKYATFEVFGKSWRFDFSDGTISEAMQGEDRNSLISPDGRLAAFTRHSNLWIRELNTGVERPLTTDGASNFAYAEPPLATRWQRDHVGGRPEAVWSPDSTHLLTLITDERQVAPLAIIEFVPEAGGRPVVHENLISLAGDPRVTEFRIMSIEVATGKQTEARYPPLTAVRMNTTPFADGLAWWSADGAEAWFVDIERHEKAAHVVAFDVSTGRSRVVFTEQSKTYVEVSVNVYTAALVFPLMETNELVWYSERNGNGHLYLYDLKTGALKNAITEGDWRLRDVQHVDPARREIFFTAAGIAPEEDPYICKPCIASLDGGAVRIVSDSPGDHLVWRPGEYMLIKPGFVGANMNAIAGVAPCGDYFVETVGRVDALPTTSLRRRSGELIKVIETATDAGLPATWTWPEAVKLKAADGVTDTYGLLFKPPNHDPGRSYPIVDYIYGGPQVSYVPKSAFANGGIAGEYLAAAALAQLGMFTLILDGRGTAFRERAFREASHGAIQTTSNIEDHIAGIRQLAERDPSIDLNRVGLTGFSGGGTAAALGALRFGDFFKVAVAGGGKYDEALFWHTWGERYHGPYDSEHYALAAARTYAGGLSGHLMIIHGMMDAGVHPAGMFQLVQALIDANKDVDLVLLPRIAHQITGYGERRRLDYFVTHLFGEKPPRDIRLVTRREIDDRLAKDNARMPTNPAAR